MAYDEDLAFRLRAALARALGPTDDIEERKMFGGVAEMVNGRMCVGVLGADLIVKMDPEEAESLASRPHVRPMDFTGRPMRGWLYVHRDGLRAEQAFDEWVQRALSRLRAAGPKTNDAPPKRSSSPRKKALPRIATAQKKATKSGR